MELHDSRWKTYTKIYSVYMGAVSTMNRLIIIGNVFVKQIMNMGAVSHRNQSLITNINLRGFLYA
jgi:hypothetical protein